MSEIHKDGKTNRPTDGQSWALIKTLSGKFEAKQDKYTMDPA